MVSLEQYRVLTLLLQLSLQKMLMKQQERLEEREQDIEDQLYKLESDKRLVEVVDPGHGWGWGCKVLGEFLRSLESLCQSHLAVTHLSD